EVGYAGFVVGAGGDDDLWRQPPRITGHDDVSGTIFGTTEGVDGNSVCYPQIENRRILFEVVGHLVFGGERVRQRREGHSGQSVVAGEREQAQRVPAFAPAVADSCMRLKDDEAQSAMGKVVTDR